MPSKPQTTTNGYQRDLVCTLRARAIPESGKQHGSNTTANGEEHSKQGTRRSGDAPTAIEHQRKRTRERKCPNRNATKQTDNTAAANANPQRGGLRCAETKHNHNPTTVRTEETEK